ncbi:phosphoribosylamine--glycine ligase [Desulfocicer vacuolatum DSM 3385]|uniref:Multifunctional fusion protein n=1 Tax=Desulfocicer vacuolatum DSM 3385 TaxID=1121400 RepID=A0A1W1ZSF6_9BACT|nr:phosphoribosylamine--glycine ligase [Desulfocicer vacuolatum]SMC50981.1 phosphoribosylamine--glycine ligase [Desulfocicer vacuolatum DSM 3385]
MKVLVVGSGGREHALVWKIAQSNLVDKIYCAPGNAGTAIDAENVAIGAEDIEALATFAADNEIDLTVVGPEAPLAQGIVDLFEEKGLKAFGASRKGAQLEASKIFAKNIMEKYGIPTARGKAFNDVDKARDYIRVMGAPLVVKADGLAAGKGVFVCTSEEEALNALDAMMQEGIFGDAGSLVVVEECLEGEEASFIALTDGKTVLPMPTSQDHKRAFDNDEGPNTGGMGAYSPAPVLDFMLRDRAMKEVMIPAVKGMAAEGIPFKGVLYAGLMIHKDQIKVLEFNVRLGDPETQPILMRLKSDLVPLMEACVDGTLHKYTTDIDPRSTMCVVMAAGGYPGAYEKGAVIKGLKDAATLEDTVVFHAGTGLDGEDVTAVGGRVLGVTALGDGVKNAMDKAYAACEKISWKDCFYRKDIGAKAIARLSIPPRVGVIMGSDSDLPVMEQALKMLKKFGIAYEVTVASAHRTPARAEAFAKTAREKGMGVIIAGAGHAAHLAGVLAAHTTLPVVGVPIDSSALKGMDSLLATVQMPPGVPVATMALGKSGAMNAGIFAAQILAASDPVLAEKLADYKKEMADKVNKRAENLAW